MSGSPVAAMSIAQIKNLQRRLGNLEQEATQELSRICGHDLWQSLGFDALDSIEDADRRARANYYYGQFQTARELSDVIG
jgi:hypothetical protein